METIQNLGTISEDGYGSQSILLRIAVDEEKVGLINYAGFKGDSNKQQQRIEKWLKLRRIRLARKELENSGYIRPMRYSSYDCTGQIFTSGIEFIYAATGYALVRMDYCRDV